MSGTGGLATAMHVCGVLGLSALFPLTRWILHIKLLQPVAHRLLSARHVQHHQQLLSADLKVPLSEPPKPPDKLVEKVCESLWKLLVYSTFTALGVAANLQQPWLYNTWQYWQGWPHHEPTWPMVLLYGLQLPFYIASVFMILFWEVRRKDFAAMLSHHVVTAALIAASAEYRLWRIGCMVMLLHDACDVLLEAAKIAQYCRADDAATAAFAAFVATWGALRLTAFPLTVLRSALLEMPAALGGGCGRAMYVGFNAGLLLLLSLNLYWFTLILRVVWLKLVTGEGRDVREDDEDD